MLRLFHQSRSHRAGNIATPLATPVCKPRNPNAPTLELGKRPGAGEPPKREAKEKPPPSSCRERVAMMGPFTLSPLKIRLKYPAPVLAKESWPHQSVSGTLDKRDESTWAATIARAGPPHARHHDGSKTVAEVVVCGSGGGAPNL